jgi:MFS family permease
MSDSLREQVNFNSSLISKRRTMVTIGYIIVIIIENLVGQATMIGLASILPTYNWLFLNLKQATSYTLAGVFYNLGKLIMIVPLSLISDLVGRRKVMIFSFSFSIASLIVIYLTNTIEIVYIGRLLFGMNSFIGVTTALIDDYYPSEARGRPLGYMSAAMIIGFALGSLLGNLIFSKFNEFSFLVLDGIVLLSLTNVIINVKDHPNWSKKEQRKLSKSERQMVIGIFRDSRFIGSIIIIFIANMTFLGSGIYWNFVILDHFDKALDPLAGLWFLPPLFADLLTYILIPVFFKKRIKKVIFYACIAGIPASIIFFLQMDIILFTIAGIVFGILNSMVIQANDTISLYFVPKEIKGTAIGILKFFMLGASTVGPLIFGLIADYIGPFTPLLFFPFMLLITVIVYWSLIYRKISAKNIGLESSKSLN